VVRVRERDGGDDNVRDGVALVQDLDGARKGREVGDGRFGEESVLS
jgi:hypothetical protein